MFAGRAYREGFDKGSLDGRAGREKKSRPSFWKGIFSKASYAAEFNRGYRAGYELGCKGEEIARQRQPQASTTERRTILHRNRKIMPERDEELSR